MSELLDWVADHYLSSRYQVYAAALPKGLLRGRAPERLQVHVEPTEAGVAALGGQVAGRALTARQLALLERLRAEGGLVAVAEIARTLETTRGAIEALARRGLVRLEMRAVRRTVARVDRLVQPPPLTAEQAEAVASIAAGNPGETFLLHGVTGSGKTEVYLQTIAATLAEGKRAIVLVPEISLTPQTIARFAARFGDRVAVLHSGLSDGERFDEWTRTRSGEAQVVVGARSAVFAPVAPLGLIVLDEEHDGAYKQETSPRYHARAVALKRAQLEGAKVVLGSATPSIEAWQAAQRGMFRLLSLSRRVAGLELPPVQLVDMRQEMLAGTRSLFSRALVAALAETIAAEDQAIVLLNRRGFAPFVLCQGCGATSECPQCSVSLTYHRDEETLRCHYCGHKRPAPSRCAACGGRAARYVGAGTQKVVEALRQALPQARVLRLDRDTASRKDAHFEILEAFSRGEADILVGTQMVAKGLDFPRVSLVGVLAADAALRLPDFRAAERTFQLVTQVAGRAGRQKPGRVIVQAFAPDHPALQAASQHDYQGFLAGEMAGRRLLGYPPFGRITVITVSAKEPERALAAAGDLRTALGGAPADILGPAPAPLEQIQGQHRFQLVLKTRHLPGTLATLRDALAKVGYRRNVRISVDVDAVSML
ncbi:MAG: primosomal protein N' [Candidatus Sericytochromatia bacterium]|uniref:Replication restart protein PriA n=1 Tax=Candidatus Tanganyikabacteria bacterium TaxID=2961651 RepID=A0A938BMV7_9BACT|nr:primosomal protein N' [Candidatus Tanganyikabacteria bacterium]